MALFETYTADERAEREAIRMECRASRHDMRRMPEPEGWVRPATRLWSGARFVLHKHCQRCGTWRHIAFDHMHRRLVSYYDKPDWYGQEAGEGRIPGESIVAWELRQVELMEQERDAARTRRRLRRVG